MFSTFLIIWSHPWWCHLEPRTKQKILYLRIWTWFRHKSLFTLEQRVCWWDWFSAILRIWPCPCIFHLDTKKCIWGPLNSIYTFIFFKGLKLVVVILAQPDIPGYKNSSWLISAKQTVNRISREKIKFSNESHFRQGALFTIKSTLHFKTDSALIYYSRSKCAAVSSKSTPCHSITVQQIVLN